MSCNTHTATNRCDTCHREASRRGTMYYHLEEPVLFTCRSCDSKSYARTYRRELRRSRRPSIKV